MNKEKQGRVEIRWKRNRIRPDPRHPSTTDITLIKSERGRSPISGFVLRLTKAGMEMNGGYRAAGVKFKHGNSGLDPEFTDLTDLDAVLEELPMQGNITDKRMRYIEGLIQSIQLQSPSQDNLDLDSSVYRLHIKRADMDIRLDWGDGDEIWSGVMDLVEALEEIYLRLLHR